MGYKQGVHYIKFHKMEDLLTLRETVKNLDYVNEIAENAYNVTLKKNTYNERFNTLKQFYMRYTEKAEGDVYDYA